MTRLLVFSLFVLTFAACKKKDTVFAKKIDNKSAKDITFYFYGKHNPVTYGDSVLVKAGQSKEIYSYFEENSSVSTQQPCKIYDDSVRVVVQGGGYLTKFLQQENGWTPSSTESSQTCTFKITDADIL